MNIIPFDGSKNLPAYLKKVDIAALNADLTAHAGGGFPVISIKGKVFAVVRDGERKVLTNPKDPESPATSIDVVIIKANKGTSKVFYLKGYDKDSDGQKPDCYSNDGTAPAADSTSPQAKKCATCPHNQWGSRISEKGTSKGKACADAVRLAVASAGQINEPMLMRVPPASIKGLGEYGQGLGKRGVGYNMVVTKIGFDMEAESPKLTFRAVGLLDDEGFAEVQETAASDIVQNILGASAMTLVEPAVVATDDEAEEPAPAVRPRAPVAKTKTVTDEEIEEAVQAAEAPVAKPAPKAVPKPAAKPAPVTVSDDLDVDLDGINFDD
jgi:hypothetical protein